jgi:hypothetical protein
MSNRRRLCLMCKERPATHGDWMVCRECWLEVEEADRKLDAANEQMRLDGWRPRRPGMSAHCYRVIRGLLETGDLSDASVATLRSKDRAWWLTVHGVGAATLRELSRILEVEL